MDENIKSTQGWQHLKMGKETNLLKHYPRTKRDVNKRGNDKTDEDRMIARQFGKDFFDGDRKNGYGGFYYNQKFWHPVVPDFVRHFNLSPNCSILDVGCAKGFMLHDFNEMIPGLTLRGIDISQYAIKNAISDMKPNLLVADAGHIPFKNNSFDLVISITTVHNLEREECIVALQEIQRVSRVNSFITVDAYHNDEEKEVIHAWNLTAKTILHVAEWKELFREAGYTGDYYWFMP